MGRTVISKKDIYKITPKHFKTEIYEEGPEELEAADEIYEDSSEETSINGTADTLEWGEMDEDELSDDAMSLSSTDRSTDSYTSRLLKYIPAEVIVLYLTLDALIRSSDKIPLWLYWAIFIFGIIGTYLYLWRVEKVSKLTQLIISCMAYCVWVFALGGPFVHTNWYEPIYAGILLPVYTFLAAIIEA